ncbi:hypothetical protein PHPALM_29746 [Phytophthora palmivora]|uniref:ABC Superfamily n=1 Tax=Phytophthora palmivora TaxID=4796 RepID=A0A2P4X6U0_9STRA|nr:hypothetical protein PHPALM_29746 [Phytophthora palmivora]
MPKKASTHGASAPSKSKTARSKTTKAKSKAEAASKRTAAAARQGGSPRRSRSRSSSPDDRPNPRFTYLDHSPGAESPVFNIPLITGSESDGDSPGSTKDPTSSQDAPSQDAPAQDAPVDDDASSEGSFNELACQEPYLNRSAQLLAILLQSLPSQRDSNPSSDEEEEEGAVSEPREISNDLDEQQERY